MYEIYQMRMPTKRTLSVCHDNNAFGLVLFATQQNIKNKCKLELQLCPREKSESVPCPSQVPQPPC